MSIEERVTRLEVRHEMLEETLGELKDEVRTMRVESRQDMHSMKLRTEEISSGLQGMRNRRDEEKADEDRKLRWYELLLKAFPIIVNLTILLAVVSQHPAAASVARSLGVIK